MSPIYSPGKLTLLKSNIYETPYDIAGARPTIDYRFDRDIPTTELNYGTNTSVTISKTVSQNGTFVNPSGYITQAQVNSLRVTSSPTTLQPQGLIVEPQRTNLTLYSEQFETWGGSGLVFTNWTNVGGFSPNGTVTAEKLIPTTSSVGHFASRIVSVAANTVHVNSVFAKASGYTWAGLSDNATGQTVFNLSDGTIVSNDSGITGLTPVSYGNGWWRLGIRYTPNGSNRGIGLDVWNNPNKTTFAGDGTSGILVWGAQIEQGSEPTSYIPTTSTSVTRSADSITINAGLTGTFTMVEKPAGCAVVSGSDIVLQTGYTVERVMSFPVALTNDQITAIRSAM